MFKKFKLSIACLLAAMMFFMAPGIPAQAAASLKASISYSKQTIHLQWSEVSGVSTYYVYRAANWQKYEVDCIATVKGTTYTDATAFETAEQYSEKTSSYSYSILYEKNGKMTVLAEKKVSFVPSSYSVKTTAATNCSSITLKWKKATNCTGYRIYEKTGTGSWKAVKSLSGTTYTIKSRKPGTTYQYMVRPYTNVGGKAIFRSRNSSSDEQVLKAKTKKISTPVLSTSSGKLKWKAISGVTGYRVYKKTVDGWKAVTTTKDCFLSVSKGKYTVRAYVKCGGKNYWGSYNKNGISVK